MNTQNATSTEFKPWFGGPGNKRDRARFARLNRIAQIATSNRASSLYGTGRTVARCWGEALDWAEINISL